MPSLTNVDRAKGPSDAGGETRPAERRRHRRQSAMWAAKLETSWGERVPCVVLDVSAGGAKIQLDYPVAANDIVNLITERVGSHWCRVAWRAGARAGLEFLESHAEAPAPRQPGQDAKFLRGRADVLRRLAQSAASRDAAARLLQAAREFDEAASAFESRDPFPSIRKDH